MKALAALKSVPAIVRLMPMIGRVASASSNASMEYPPTIGSRVPTFADDWQDGAYDRQASTTDSHSAIEGFNDRQRAVGTGIAAQPIGEPTITVDGPTAAIAFVHWVAEHNLAGEWKVDEVVYIASEDFAPANGIRLPPRRVFLGALKKTPGVISTPNRRVYDRNGNLLGKTTFYRLPTPEVRTAFEYSALRLVRRAA